MRLNLRLPSKPQAIKYALDAVLGLCMIAVGVCLANLWYEYHPEQKHSVQVVSTEYRIYGDVNGDQHCNTADLEIIKANWNKANPTYGDGDLNEDGKIDAQDLSIVSHYQGNGGKPIILIST